MMAPSEQDTNGGEAFSANLQEQSKAESIQRNNLRVEYLCEQIISNLSQATTMYHRLIVVVEPLAGSKAADLRQVGARTSCHYINVNLELSRCLLELTQQQRSRQVSKILNEIVDRDYVNQQLAHTPRQVKFLEKSPGKLTIECDEMWSFVNSKKTRFISGCLSAMCLHIYRFLAGL